jgi:prepilin-type processing-associated H-X9-DG protein
MSKITVRVAGQHFSSEHNAGQIEVVISGKSTNAAFFDLHVKDKARNDSTHRREDDWDKVRLESKHYNVLLRPIRRPF